MKRAIYCLNFICKCWGISCEGLFIELVHMLKSSSCIFFHNQNHQCELVVCSAAESLYYRPQPKRLTERSPLCTTSTHGFFKNLLFLSFLISLSRKWVVLFE